jgi:hypothetical protein
MASDFVSVDAALLKALRKSDGSLRDIEYLKLAPGSKLRDAGADVGLPFEGAAAPTAAASSCGVLRRLGEG